jgi:hypothetical protein
MVPPLLARIKSEEKLLQSEFIAEYDKLPGAHGIATNSGNFFRSNPGNL